jgi:hypothetical protein
MNHCKDCRWCDPVSDADGFCHRWPAVFIEAPLKSGWPPVSLERGWCGEFLKRRIPRTAAELLQDVHDPLIGTRVER